MKEKIKIRVINFINRNFRSLEGNYTLKNKKIFLLLTPLHGNLGDQAIAYSELVYLKKNFPDYDIHEVPLVKYSRMNKSIKKSLNSGDLIFIHGGGNLGDLYYSEEYFRRLIIKDFKKNRVNSFPQSLAFKDNSIKEMQKSKKIYNAHKNIEIVIRESNSFVKAQEIFDENIITYYPDIVMYNEVTDRNQNKNDVLFLLRNDVEKVSNEGIINKIEESLKKNQIKFDISDTQLGSESLIDTKNRFELLDEKLNEISKYKLVVTDRLHGMVLSYISGIPCIALNNSTRKVEATYNDWLKDAESICLLKSEDYTFEYVEKLVLDLYSKKGSDLSIQDLFEGMFK